MNDILKAAHKSMEVPLRYRGLECIDFDVEYNNQKELLQRVQELAQQRKWIFLSGSTPGTGKTHLAVIALGLSWALDRYKNGEPPPPETYIYIPVRDFSEQLISLGYDRYNYITDLRRDHRCIMFDEIGRERPDNQIVIQSIENIIDNYYNYQKQIIVTTALSLKEMISRYDGSMLDRISEMGEVIEVSGKSYRKQLKTQQ